MNSVYTILYIGAAQFSSTQIYWTLTFPGLTVEPNKAKSV